jgi:hypothetical protein
MATEGDPGRGRGVVILAALLALSGCAVTRLDCPEGLGRGCSAWSLRLFVGQTLVLVDGNRMLSTTNEPRDLPVIVPVPMQVSKPPPGPPVPKPPVDKRG